MRISSERERDSTPASNRRESPARSGARGVDVAPRTRPLLSPRARPHDARVRSAAAARVGGAAFGRRARVQRTMPPSSSSSSSFDARAVATKTRGESKEETRKRLDMESAALGAGLKRSLADGIAAAAEAERKRAKFDAASGGAPKPVWRGGMMDAMLGELSDSDGDDSDDDED